ncbi:MAG: hypothetical protein ACLTBV_25840 [Enterocloster bolteae]
MMAANSTVQREHHKADVNQRLDGKDYSDRDYFHKAMAGQAGHIRSLWSAEVNENVHCGRPYGRTDGLIQHNRRRGILRSAESIFKRYCFMQVHISDNSAAYAINSDGYTIADNHQHNHDTNIEEEEIPIHTGQAGCHTREN